MAIHNSKVCAARSGARLWIEGKRLSGEGWQRGDEFSVEFCCGEIRIHRHLDRLANWVAVRHVSGKGDKPIIDVVGADVQKALGSTGTPLTVHVTPNLIVAKAD